MINHIQNWVQELFRDPLLKNQNWTYIWINSLKIYAICFYCMSKLRDQYILKYTIYAIHIICSIMLYVLYLLYILCILNILSILSCRPLAFTWSISLSTSFSACFLANIFLTLYSINLPNFIACLHLLHEMLGNMFIVIESIILILY